MSVRIAIAFLLGFATAAAAAAIMALLWWEQQPASVLVQGLPKDWAAADRTFAARVRARFPPGTPLTTMIGDLKDQGFVPTWFEPGGSYGAKRVQDDFPCEIVARVVWRGSADGRLAAVSGSYGEEGCL